MIFPKPNAWRSNRYLEFVRGHPCLMCQRYETVAHHEGLYKQGVGTKPPDSHCVPLCVYCHARRHSGGISRFYGNVNLEGTIIELLTEYLQSGWVVEKRTT